MTTAQNHWNLATNPEFRRRVTAILWTQREAILRDVDSNESIHGMVIWQLAKNSAGWLTPGGSYGPETVDTFCWLAAIDAQVQAEAQEGVEANPSEETLAAVLLRSWGSVAVPDASDQMEWWRIDPESEGEGA